jgi:hypothetical protein
MSLTNGDDIVDEEGITYPIKWLDPRHNPGAGFGLLTHKGGAQSS